MIRIYLKKVFQQRGGRTSFTVQRIYESCEEVLISLILEVVLVQFYFMLNMNIPEGAFAFLDFILFIMQTE